MQVSTRDNLYWGCRPHCKDCTAKVKWDTNKDNNENINVSITEIKKSVVNTYAEYSWCLLFDIEWSNKPLKDAWDTKENRDNSEQTQDTAVLLCLLFTLLI